MYITLSFPHSLILIVTFDDILVKKDHVRFKEFAFAQK